jgi:hypothetical protein
MASIISAGTTSGTSLNLSGDTSGVLQLASNGSTTAVTITTAQDVGIGTSSPAVKTEISGTAAASNLALRITNIATDGYSTLQMGDGNAGVYRNGSAQSSYAGASSLNLITVGSHAIGLATGNTIRAVIPAAGGVQAVTCVSVGNATPASTGAGITFPASQSASTDANTLDDYEEGTWTPTITGSSSNPTVTYTAQTGFYTKIGRMVSIQGRVGLSARTGGGGNLRISGLPFANGGGLAGASSSWFSFVTLSAGYTTGSSYIEPNSSFLSFAESGNNVSANQLGVSAFGNAFDITFSFTYIIQT